MAAESSPFELSYQENGEASKVALCRGVCGQVVRGTVEGLEERGEEYFLLVRDRNLLAYQVAEADYDLIGAKIELRGVQGARGQVLWHCDPLQVELEPLPLKAAEVVREYRDKIIPTLEENRHQAFERRKELGLVRNVSPIGEVSYSYPEELQRGEAHQAALDEVGGEPYVQLRKQVANLDYLDAKAVGAIYEFNQDLQELSEDRRKSQAVETRRRALYAKARETRDLFNKYYGEFQKEVDALGAPEKLEAVKKLMQTKLAAARSLRIERQRADQEYALSHRELKAAQMTQREFRTADNVVVEVVRTRSGLPVPAQRVEFEQALAQKREALLQKGRERELN